MYQNFRRLLVIYKGARGPFIVSQVLLAVSVLLNLAIVALNGTLVNDGVQQGNIDVVISTAVWMIGLTLVQTVFALANSLYAVLFAEGTANFLRVGAYRKIQTLSFGNLDRFRTSDLLVRLTSDINNVKQAVLYGILLLFQAPFMIVMAVALAVFMLPSLLWLMVVIMAVVSVVLFFLLRGVQQMFLARQQALDGVNNVLQEALAGVRVVKAFVRERFEMQRFAKASTTWLDAALRPAYRLALFVPTLQMIVYIGTAALYYFGGQSVLLTGDTNLGEIIVFSNVLSMVIGPMAMLAFIVPFLEAGEASCGRLFEVFDQQAEIQDRPTTQTIDIRKCAGRIVFENASFGYRSETGKVERLTLQNINLTIEPGQTVGFLGATGSGKSTLVNLIPRFYDLVEGRVTIDGIDVRDIPKRQLDQIVGMALQEAVLFSGTVRGNILFYDRQPIGEIMSRATNDIDTIDNFFSRGLNQLMTATLTIVVIVTVMFFLNVTLAVITLVTMPIMLGVALFMGRIAGPAFAQLQEKLSDANGFMEEALAGNKTILAYGQQRQSGDSLEDLSVGVRDTGAKAMLAALSVTPIVNVAQNSQQAIIALVGSIMAIQGVFGFGTVLTFITYSSQLQSPVQQLGQIYNTILQAAAGAARVFAILDEAPMVQDAPAAKDLELKGGHVVFDNVDFSYVKGRKILRGNTFEAKPGQKIGLCGPTGAGKSTIMNILTRYYDVDSGTITIDGQNIATLTQNSLRRQIGAVLQEAFLFSDTVMNNLKYAREGATDVECIAAAQQANAHDFIMELPQGYDTLLTERGANLSQGQRQMLTIARAMVANPKMLILDEATSNVDTRTEKLIQEGLQRLMEGKTSFVIAHRLSTIRDSARILAIKDGVIVEQGTHEELMRNKGLYYDLYMTQFRVRPEAAV